MQRIWENSLTSVSACQSSSVSAANRPGRAPPALLTRMSTPPSAAAAPSTNAVTCSGSVTSQASATIWALSPACLASAAAASSSSAACREQIATAAPSASSSAAMARPRPLEPPVTTARRPASPRST